MAVTADAMTTWCRRLLGADPQCPKLPLEQYLAAIPRLDALAALLAGTRVLVRGDVDAKPGPKVGDGDIRLRSMVDTLEYGRQRGWVQIIFGHIGRKPEGSLNKVRARLAELLHSDVVLVEDWLDPATVSITEQAAAAIKACSAGGFVLLQNTRKYDVERVLWKAKPADLPGTSGQLAKLANEFADKVAKVYVNEAFSAGSLDASSTIVPAAMRQVALGRYLAEQFSDHWLKDCLDAEMVVFSGLKADKLDDLEAMIQRGKIRRVIAAGSLAMALKRAAAELDGGAFGLGLAEDPAHADKPYFIPRKRIDQAKQMIAAGRAKGIEFVMPVDFVLQDGRMAESIGPGDQQFDVGPASSALFAAKVGELIAAQRPGKPGVVFHNGVFGMFEDPRFAQGTRLFVAQLKRMKDAGLKVYVGGGEGGTALEKYGQPDWVTYCFTAGGTVLNALGSEPVPYLVALKMAAEG